MKTTKKELKLTRALQLLRELGYGGRHVYVPAAEIKKMTAEEALTLLNEGKSIEEVAKISGYTSIYLRRLKKEQ